ncbi:MAG: hypothetical protein AB4426_20605 [Xenococcaceae cyanobacterium]
MINSKNIKTTVGATVGLLAIGAITGSMPASAGETLITPTGTAQDLEGVQARTLSDWPWAVGGQYPQATETNYQVKQEGLFNQPQIERLNLTLDVADENVGDTNRITRRLPLIKF